MCKYICIKANFFLDMFDRFWLSFETNTNIQIISISNCFFLQAILIRYTLSYQKSWFFLIYSGRSVST